MPFTYRFTSRGRPSEDRDEGDDDPPRNFSIPSRNSRDVGDVPPAAGHPRMEMRVANIFSSLVCIRFPALNVAYGNPGFTRAGLEKSRTF